MSYELMSKNFMAMDAEYDDAKIVIFGAPFDSTCSFRPGTRFASQAMRKDFIGLETYSPYQDLDLSDYELCDYGDLDLPMGDVSRTLDQVESLVKKILSDKKIPLMIGGEHGLSLGAFRAMNKIYEKFAIIQFDAHTDLRDDYLGLKLSHASVIKRAHEIVGDGYLHQFAIRSGEKEEFLWAKEHSDLHKFNFDGLDEVVNKLAEEQIPVYFTLDLDVLDPSVFPGTGTPEPGGVSFNELREAIMKLKPLNIVATDIMELSPPYDNSGVSTAVACKILRELTLLLADKNKIK